MSWWTKTTKRQRGWVKAHEAKADGKHARREEDERMIKEQVETGADRYFASRMQDDEYREAYEEAKFND